MAVREKPVFIGEPKTQCTNLPASTATTYDVFSSDAINSQAITAINYWQASAVAVAITIKIHNGTSAFTLAKFSSAATANLSLNLLSSQYLPFIDDFNPVLLLDSGWKLQIEVDNANNNKDVYIAGGIFA